MESTEEEVTVPNLGSLPRRIHAAGSATAKRAAPYHRNTVTAGPCHYYRARSGQRLIFRENEISEIDPTPLGAVITVRGGLEYKVSSPKPELIA
jgi:hypothetical protein